MIFRVVTICLLLVLNKSFSQNFEDFLVKNAIEIGYLSKPKNDIFMVLQDARFISVGEHMHGMKEPATFCLGLAKLFIRNGKDVQIGLEIAPEYMNKYLCHPKDKNVRKCYFFSDPFHDGRSNKSWAKIITQLNHRRQAEIFFFDVSKYGENDRDSLMAQCIKEQVLKHPEKTTIILTSMVHGMLDNSKGEKKMMAYLSEDKDLNFGNKLYSFCQLFEHGQIRRYENQDWIIDIKDLSDSEYYSPYTKTLKNSNYISMFPSSFTDFYSKKFTGFFFIKNINPVHILD